MALVVVDAGAKQASLAVAGIRYVGDDTISEAQSRRAVAMMVSEIKFSSGSHPALKMKRSGRIVNDWTEGL